MLFFIVAVIVGLIILGSFALAVFAKGPEDKSIGITIAAVASILLLGFTLILSATTVGARNVGIQTEFGRYKSTLDSGFQWTTPYSNVEEFSTQIQPLGLGGRDNPVSINFQGGGRGSVDGTVRWRIDSNNAEFLWRKYRTFDNVRDQLVNSTAKDSLRVVIGKYLPNDARAGENVRPITAAVKADLEQTLKSDGIIIDSVSLQGIYLDEATQKSLERTVVANNNIETAKSEQERAKIDAETAKIRQDGGSLTDANLTRYCLEVVNAWDVKKNGPLPAGFNCIGGAAPFSVVGR